MLALFLGKLEKFEALETRFLDHDGNGLLSDPRRKIPWSLTILKGYSLGSTAVPRIFFTLRVRTGRSLSWVTFRIKTPAARNSSIPLVRSWPARGGKVRGDKVCRGKIGLQQVNEHPSVFLHAGR